MIILQAKLAEDYLETEIHDFVDANSNKNRFKFDTMNLQEDIL